MQNRITQSGKLQIDLLNVRRSLPANRTSSLEWSGDDPEGWRSVSFQGAIHAFQRQGETSKILASRGLGAGDFVAGHIGTRAGAVLGSWCLRHATCSSGNYTDIVPQPTGTFPAPINYNQPTPTPH